LNETTNVVGMDDNTSEEEHVPNKSEFVDQLAKRLDGDRKRAAAVLDAVIDNVYAAIDRGEHVAITGFGVFERRDRAARTGRNPATGESVQVPATRVPAFRPGAEFKSIASGAAGKLKERSEHTQEAVARAFRAVREASGAAPATRSPAAKSAAKKTTAKKTAAKKTTAKKATAKKTAAKKATAKKAPAKKATAKKTAKKAPVKKATAKKATAKKATAKKTAAKKAPVKKATAKKAPAKKATAKKTAKKAPAKKR
jgi:DNA-binding protein HU-beta